MRRALWLLGGLAGAWLIAFGVTLGLNALGAALFEFWGVTSENIARAPGWLQWIVLPYAQWSAIVQSLLVIGYAGLLIRLTSAPGDPNKRVGGDGAKRMALTGVCGLLAAAVLTALMRFTDAVRFGWSLMEPALSAQGLLSVALYGLSAFGAGRLFRAWLLPLLADWPTDLACVGSAIAFALMTSAAYGPLALINQALLGYMLALGFVRTGEERSGSLFHGAFFAFLFCVMGFSGGAPGALYETYYSGADLWSGGALGPMNSLLTTLLLASGAAAYRLWPMPR